MTSSTIFEKTSFLPAVYLSEVPAPHGLVRLDSNGLQGIDQLRLLAGVQEPCCGARGLLQLLDPAHELVIVGPQLVMVDLRDCVDYEIVGTCKTQQ